MGDLDKLIEAVEAGDMWSETQYAVFGNGTDLVNAYQAAFDGSLDAALRLHEALLPGWVITIERVNSGRWMATLRLEPSIGTVRADDDIGARAFLLAILRALQAQSTPLDEPGPVDPGRRG